MSSIQERLQLKRVPMDTWNIREQLCLASAVARSGDQNWMSVSRALKTVGDPNRPADWYSQKSCAAQYGALLEHVETPKRKKRNSEGAGETPQESILNKLTQERIADINKSVAELTQHYQTIQSEIAEVRDPATTEERVRAMWSAIESSMRARERETARRAAWLREREERRQRAARPDAKSDSNASSSGGAGAPSSPLLTSLLKSSPVVTTPQHLPHPANVVDAISPSANAPTLSQLLEKTTGSQGQPMLSSQPSSASIQQQPAVVNQTASLNQSLNPSLNHENQAEMIEMIKSELQEIEHKLKARSTPSPAPPLPPVAAEEAPPPVDIDDIEIKAEDVYAFRDVDIEIRPVADMHKAHAQRAVEKPMFHKREEAVISSVGPDEASTHEDTQTDKLVEVEDATPEEAIQDEPMPQNQQEFAVEEQKQQEEAPPEPEPEAAPPEPEVMVSFPEVKFPTPEIKVIQPEEIEIKQEDPIVPETPSPPPPPPPPAPHVEVDAEDQRQLPGEVVEVPPPSLEDSVPPTEVEESKPIVVEPVEESQEVAAETTEPETVEFAPEPEKSEEVPVPVVKEEQVEPEETIEVPQPTPEVVEAPPLPAAPPAEVEPGSASSQDDATTAEPEDKDEDKSLEEIKKEVELEESLPLTEVRERETEDVLSAAATETDDDTPMELVREEEKDGKKKRDYSRKKKPDSRTCSGSESAAETSAPDSPCTAPPAAPPLTATSTDPDRQHRLWKKSIMLVYSRLAAHKYASLFLRPISDAEAPGYSRVVRRPMDLTTIKRNIDSGLVRTTAEFQRDVLLMFMNALMYNSSEHRVYQMAKEMFHEAENQLGILLAAQAHAGLSAPARRRRHHDADTTDTKRRYE